MNCALGIDDNQGLIFSSSIKPISGTVSTDSGNLDSYAILISNKNSVEIVRKPLRPDNSGNRPETSFTWDLKSKSDSFVESGCYIISLIDESKGIECCSTECKVVDTRSILSITRSLKRSQPFSQDASQRLFSIYLDIIEDIEIMILDKLKNNQFEDPYFVASTTARFIQEIADDIANRLASRFLDQIEKFASKNHMSTKDGKLGLWTLFDFLVNYMADTEDHARANAMAKCGKCHLSQNDKAQIVSSLVLGILPHCKTITFPKNVIGGPVEKLIEGIIKVGIKYLSTKHVNRSISICQTSPSGNPCDIVIR